MILSLRIARNAQLATPFTKMQEMEFGNVVLTVNKTCKISYAKHVSNKGLNTDVCNV